MRGTEEWRGGKGDGMEDVEEEEEGEKKERRQVAGQLGEVGGARQRDTRTCGGEC